MDEITDDQVIARLLKACPAAQPAWDEHAASDAACIGLMMDMLPFTAYVIECLERGVVDLTVELFEEIDSLLINHEDAVHNQLVYGLLEGIQNTALNRKLDARGLRETLPECTRKEWDALNAIWGGNPA